MRSVTRPSKAAVVSGFRCGQILEAARQAFVKTGVAKTSVDQIARSAGIAKGTIYLYYKSKDDILRQLLDADLAELQAETLPAISNDGALDVRLDRFFRAFLGFFERNRDFIEQCHLDMSPDVRKKAKQKLGLVFSAQAAAWTDALVESRRGGRDAGHMTVARARALAHTIIALAHGLAIQRLRGWHPASVEDAAAMAAGLVANGVQKS
jgi:AcrR family transcriptional regulator